MNIKQTRIGVISALSEEQSGLIELMQKAVTVHHGMRDYVAGDLWGIACVCVLSRIGKVAAAATTAVLIEKFGVTHIIFTGVAGAAYPGVRIGDIVVARQLVQHDMNAMPLFPRFEVPLTGLSEFFSDQLLSRHLLQASQQFIDRDFISSIPESARCVFNLDGPRVHEGLIASGDEFITQSERLLQITENLPEVLAVEMEGAAVAQVCFEFGIPFAIVRTISDSANEDSPADFVEFLEKVAARYAFGIVKNFFSIHKTAQTLQHE